jgi:hypothetical protein
MTSAPNTDPPPSNGYTSMPRWVTWSLIAAVALVVLVLFVVLIVGGQHGPGRHASAPGPVTHDGASVALSGR